MGLNRGLARQGYNAGCPSIIESGPSSTARYCARISLKFIAPAPSFGLYRKFLLISRATSRHWYPAYAPSHRYFPLPPIPTSHDALHLRSASSNRVEHLQFHSIDLARSQIKLPSTFLRPFKSSSPKLSVLEVAINGQQQKDSGAISERQRRAKNFRSSWINYTAQSRFSAGPSE